MIKPNLIVSHDWHVQPICQRSLTCRSPERDRGSRYPDLHPDVLELVLRGKPEALLLAPAFLREPSKHIALRFTGLAVFVFLSLIPAARFSYCVFDGRRADSLAGRRRIALRKNIKDQLRKSRALIAHKRLEPIGLTGDKLPGHAMDCSLRVSLQGSRGTCLT